MMSSFLSDFLLLLAATNAGLIAGYFLPRKTSAITRDESERVKGSATPEPLGADRSADFLLAVQQITEDLAAGVGAHSQQVHAISSELKAGGCDIASLLSRLISANDSMEKQLEEAESRSKDQAAMIQLHVTEARTDALTGLPNRRAFDDEMQKQFEIFKNQGTPATLLMLDIDYFKKLNDTYGHLVGDDVLKSTADLLTKAIRSGDRVARYGGEEFAVILPQSKANGMLRIVEDLRQAFSLFTVTIDSQTIQISASAGLAELLPGDSIKSWIRRADDALYHAKHQGRNCGYWHDGKSIHRIGQPVQQTSAVPEETAEKPSGEVERQLMSRSAFDNSLAMLLSENQRSDQNLSMILMRIDRFETIAEMHGFDAKRLVHQTIGHTLLTRVGIAFQVADLGTDSFGIILPSTRMDEAVVTGLKIRNAISATAIMVAGKAIEVSVSMGVGDEHRRSPKRPLMDRVNDALTAASKLGGNQVVASKGGGFVQVSNSAGQSRNLAAV